MVDTPIVSESLQKTFRDNFPSQINSGRDLHVSDVITPIVDFSAVAGTTGINQTLQEAIAYGNAITISQVGSGTASVTSTPGFYRMIGTLSIAVGNALNKVDIVLTDGSTAKIVYASANFTSIGSTQTLSIDFDKVFFVNTGETLQVICSTNNYTSFVGSARQIADISGTLVNPTGYTGE